MISGENVTVRRNDDPRAQALRLAFARLELFTESVAKKPPEKRVVEQWIGRWPLADGHGRIDIDHAGSDLLDDRRKARGRLDLARQRRFLDIKLWRRIGCGLAGREPGCRCRGKLSFQQQ